MVENVGERKTRGSQGHDTVFISSSGYNVHGAMRPREERQVGRVGWAEEGLSGRAYASGQHGLRL